MMSLVPLCNFAPAYIEVTLLLVFFFAGRARSYNFTPYLIASQSFDASGPDKAKMELWEALNYFGDTIGLLSMALMVQSFGWDWKVSMEICIAFFLLISVLLFVLTDEVDMTHNIQEPEDEPVPQNELENLDQ